MFILKFVNIKSNIHKYNLLDNNIIFLMKNQMNIMYLIVITLILFSIYYVLTFKIEQFEQNYSKNKECSQKAINNAYTNYIFSGIKTIR